MKIIIDNSADAPVFYLDTDNGWIKEAAKAALKKPLLACLESVLKKQKKVLKDLSGVAVVTGRGRFTAARIAVTVANTLAFALNIPVIGVNEVNFKRIEQLFKSAKAGHYVSAKYSGEARIGGKKSKI